MRRLLYCLLGSTLFHGALMWVPFPMSVAGAGKSALQPVRVELVDEPRAPRSEAPKRVARQSAQTETPTSTAPPRATKTRPKVDRPQAPARPGLRVVKTVPTAPKRVDPAPERTQLATKMRPEQPRTEPTRSPEPATAAKTAEMARPVDTTAPARKPTGETGGNDGAGFSPARYARTATPRYPGKARRAGWEGTTVLKVRVDPKGAPDRVAVDRTSGFDILDAAAVKAVQRWKFHPARRGLDAVPSWVRIPVAFKLKEDRR